MSDPMNLDQLGAIANVAGYVVPIFFSLTIAATYARPYFFRWTLSYMFYLPAIMSAALPAPYVDWLAVTVAALICYHLGTWFLLLTIEGVQPDRPPFRKLRAAWWGTLAIGGGMLMAGQPLTLAIAAPGLLMVVVYLIFAVRMWTLGQADTRRSARALAVMLALVGLWAIAFPALSGTPYMWMGFVVSGVLHLMLGIQMVVYMLEDVAAMLRTQNEQLQALDGLKSSFISTVSHELRTPITAIKSASWLLTAAKRMPEPTELGAIIGQQADQLSRIVDDMLDFSVLESGGMTYYQDRFELGELAEEAVQGALPMFAEKGLVLDFEPGAQPVPVEGDPERLKQVIGNLLANALKFTEPGGRVGVHVVSAGSMARLSVTDSGIGIAPEHRTRIFERFYQVDATNTRRSGGAGLGLAISRAIVEDGHHGRIWVEEAPGGGSTFVMTLPLAQAKAGTAPLTA
jgi:signal transduction histidine kinase